MEVGFRRRLGLEPGQMLGLVVPQQEWQIGAQADDGAKKRTGGQLRLRSSLHIDGRATLHHKNLFSRSHESESSVCTVSSETWRKDLQPSDKLILNNHVYFNGSL